MIMQRFFSKSFTKTKHVRVLLPKAALETVFDECDRYDADETGGRILGTYRQEGDELIISVSGIIEPGPGARRTATSFFQDGEYQEKVFRQVEDQSPSVEHLGNWHTHHVNGLRHLSGGDIDTYRRIVGHKNHNIDIFYALLVIERKDKQGLNRYVHRHYLFRRDDDAVYEIPAAAVDVVEAPLLWPTSAVPAVEATVKSASTQEALQSIRVFDKAVLNQFFPSLKPFMAKELGVYWRGPIELVDGSQMEVVVTEDSSNDQPQYTLTVRNPPAPLVQAAKKLGDHSFSSCREALITAERTCNVVLFGKQ